jgi:diamine N-acetyltransferase
VLTDRTSSVSLREIDEPGGQIAIGLRVSSAQAIYVASNERSLIDAKANPGARCSLIYADRVPVGFALLFLPFLPRALARPNVRSDQIVLWRFMIDHRYQRMGFGHQALGLIREECRSHTNITEICRVTFPAPKARRDSICLRGSRKPNACAPVERKSRSCCHSEVVEFARGPFLIARPHPLR